MLRDLRAYVMTILTHSPSRLCVTLALGLIIFAPFAEPRWAGGFFVSGAALAYGAAGFFAWRKEAGGRSVAE